MHTSRMGWKWVGVSLAVVCPYGKGISRSLSLGAGRAILYRGPSASRMALSLGILEDSAVTSGGGNK